MTRKLERFDIHVERYIVSTMHFQARHHGELILLTGAAMERGFLPDNDRTLAEITKSTLRAWRRDREYIEPFFEVGDGRWVHRRAYIGRVSYEPDSGRPRQAEWRIIRDRIFARDNYTCTYCGTRGGKLQCDHVVPISRDGSNDDANLTTACMPCNRAKWAKTPEEWRATQ